MGAGGKEVNGPSSQANHLDSLERLLTERTWLDCCQRNQDVRRSERPELSSPSPSKIPLIAQHVAICRPSRSGASPNPSRRF